MTIGDFVRGNKLEPGDVFQLSKVGGEISNQKVVYLGFTGLEHKFIANTVRGIDWLSPYELSMLSRLYRPINIRKFAGSQNAQKAVIVRAVRSMKKHAFHLLTYNQAQLTKYVRTGQPPTTNQQSQALGVGLAATGVILATTSKSDAAKAFGIVAAIAGAFIALSNEEKKVI